MRIKGHRKTDLTVSVSALIFSTGVLLGSFTTGRICSNELIKLQNRLISTEESLRSYQDAYKEAVRNAQYEYEVNENLELDLAEAMATIYNLKNEEYQFIYIGDFKLTHYCTETEEHICSDGTDLTATGTKVTPGKTIAVDPTIIPYGTDVYIEGYGIRTAEDCGGAVKGNHIDIAVNSHDEAIDMGTTNGGVWLLVKK